MAYRAMAHRNRRQAYADSHIAEELAGIRGYRLVGARWTRFRGDYARRTRSRWWT